MIQQRLFRKRLSLALAALMLTPSVAVPVLERGELSNDQVIESAHDPGRCGHSHDHRICTQVGANFSLSAIGYEYRTAPLVVRLAKTGQAQSALLDSHLQGPPARAPPLV